MPDAQLETVARKIHSDSYTRSARDRTSARIRHSRPHAPAEHRTQPHRTQQAPTRTSSTSPPAAHQDGQRKHRDPYAGSRSSMSCDITLCLGVGFEPSLSRRFHSPSLLAESNAAELGIRHLRPRPGPTSSAMCPCTLGSGVRRATDRDMQGHGRAGGSGYTDRPPDFLPLTLHFTTLARCRRPLVTCGVPKTASWAPACPFLTHIR
jgi:hypothetical protein